jgi:hypothetical protein
MVARPARLVALCGCGRIDVTGTLSPEAFRD